MRLIRPLRGSTLTSNLLHNRFKGEEQPTQAHTHVYPPMYINILIPLLLFEERYLRDDKAQMTL
jgi:hypothetical protein